MKLWPFQKKSAPQDDAAAVAPGAANEEPAETRREALETLYPAPETGSEYELVIPVVPEEQPAPAVAEAAPGPAVPPEPMLHLVSPSRPEAVSGPVPQPEAEAPAGMPLLKTDLPRLQLVPPMAASPAPVPEPDPPADVPLQEPSPEVSSLPTLAEVVDFGDYYGDAYDLPEPTGVFENTPKPDRIEPAAPEPPLPVRAETPLPPPAAPDRAASRPAEAAGYADSIADALSDFEQQIIWQDNRFLNKSINDLVDRYFAQSEEESGREAV